jgi:hypothetical protein
MKTQVTTHSSPGSFPVEVFRFCCEVYLCLPLLTGPGTQNAQKTIPVVLLRPFSGNEMSKQTTRPEGVKFFA